MLASSRRSCARTGSGSIWREARTCRAGGRERRRELAAEPAGAQEARYNALERCPCRSRGDPRGSWRPCSRGHAGELDPDPFGAQDIRHAAPERCLPRSRRSRGDPRGSRRSRSCSPRRGGHAVVRGDGNWPGASCATHVGRGARAHGVMRASWSRIQSTRRIRVAVGENVDGDGNWPRGQLVRRKRAPIARPRNLARRDHGNHGATHVGRRGGAHGVMRASWIRIQSGVRPGSTHMGTWRGDEGVDPGACPYG